jgi:hypothetical protein
VFVPRHGGATNLKEKTMGLELIRVSSGQRRECVRVGSYSGVHALRACLVLELVARLWQREDLPPENVQDMLACVRGPALARKEVDLHAGVELTEEDLQRLLDDGDLDIDYELLRDDDSGAFLQYVGRHVEIDTPVHAVLIGAAKFIDHSDCDGVYSRGDVLDVSAFFNFLASSPVLKLPDWLQARLRALQEFFDTTAGEGGCVVFA